MQKLMIIAMLFLAFAASVFGANATSLKMYGWLSLAVSFLIIVGVAVALWRRTSELSNTRLLLTALLLTAIVWSPVAVDRLGSSHHLPTLPFGLVLALLAGSWMAVFAILVLLRWLKLLQMQHVQEVHP